jgi:4'-phosphopantetheinyl transferase
VSTRGRRMISVDSLQGTQSVDVWAVWLSAPTPGSCAFRALISSEEILRADRFVFEHLRVSYEVSHGVLRVLLAQYLKCSPRELVFTFGRRGKPTLCGDSQLRFNMSHSGGLAVYAFTFGCEIGVDIEEVRDMCGFEQIAERYFCRAEASQLLSITGEEQREDAFFRCWTRKESYIKAIGDGLCVPLDQFQVTLLPDAPARFVHIGHDTSSASTWTLQHLEPVPGYVGALAYHADARNIVLRPPQHAQDILDLFMS